MGHPETDEQGERQLPVARAPRHQGRMNAAKLGPTKRNPIEAASETLHGSQAVVVRAACKPADETPKQRRNHTHTHSHHKPMKIEFITDIWEFSHGKLPKGRGSWAFTPHRNCDACHPDVFWTPGNTTYAEAKKLAQIHFAGKTEELYVMP